MLTLCIPDTPEVAADARIKPGRYVCEDVNAAEMLLIYRALRPTIEPFVAPLVEFNFKVLVMGGMGLGDALMLTPVLRELKRRDERFQIDICCNPTARQIFLGLPYIDGFLDYPPRAELLQDFGTVLFLEGAIEFNLLARTQNMTERFAQHLGVAAGEWDKKPDFRLTMDELDWAKKTFSRTAGKRRLGLQVQAGMRCRSYPMSQLCQGGPNGSNPSFIEKMVRAGWEIGLLGLPGEFRVDQRPKEVIDMSRFGLSFRQSAAFLTTCDAFLGPDSSLLHAAGALDIPAVGLFGPIPFDLRTRYYDSVFALHGNGACPKAPCFHSFHAGLPEFPLDGPCAATGRCEELAAIEPDRICSKIEQIACGLVLLP